MFNIAFPIKRHTSHSTSSDGGPLSRTSTAVDDGLDDPKGPLGLNLLHHPLEPTVDFIFVHGLGGGSRKTWSKTDSLCHYWPAEWLPRDPAFEGVRIHSYGYNSDWAKGNENCLNIHHIGKSLLGELATSPHIAEGATSLVLIGHSMGGLVIKKAYMLAHQDPAHRHLAERTRAIYFLGTPHRGADSARILKNILQIASSAPAYVTDLVRGSGALQSINDEFRHYSGEICLRSFYETQKLSSKGFSTLIVDPESATLGYREEWQMPMNADHRSICKFDSPSDQNFTILRNALASTVKGISETESNIKHLRQRDSTKALAEYLGITENIEDDLMVVQDARMEGTCRWISAKENYQNWKTPRGANSPILWIDGKPATGKSVLSGYVIDDLRASGMNCSYYFFKHNDKSKSKLSACLRSLAFQMASTDTAARDKLLELQEDHVKIEHDNERSLWRSLFASGIFQVTTSPHFWVIDALDECSNPEPLFESMLSKFDYPGSLNVLVTSRETPQFLKIFSGLGPRLRREQISSDETHVDIERIITSRAESLIAEDDESRLALVEKVLEKSRGSFLWTVLVLDELSSAFSEQDIKQVLDEVPRGMEPLYRRALETMARATRGKKLAKAILEWAACAMRPLTVPELCTALEIELEDKFPRLMETVTALCGQLVSVDKFGRVQMIHETAREFLLSDELESEFSVTKTEAHTRMAKACLLYLTGNDLKPPRTGRRHRDLSAFSEKTPFFAYACTAFSYHLTQADPTANDLLSLVDRFLKLNILSWIENAAQTKNLGIMVRTAKDLKTYVELCAAERSPLRPDIQAIKSWTTDLQRIAAKFTAALITSPSAIYSLIPPFCPIKSAIHNTAATGKKLSVVGLPDLHWDDRLSCIDFRQERTSALCYGENFLAIGLTSGRIALYHPTSCQEYRSLNHGEAIKHLRLRGKSDHLASSGLKTIRVWNIRTGQLLHCLQSPRKCLDLLFDGSRLLAPSNNNEIWSWDLDDGAVMQPTAQWRDSPDDGSRFLRRPPSALSIGVAHKMLAVAYSSKPVTIWDLEGNVYLGSCGKKLATGETALDPVLALQFNPNPNIELLAVSYLDGDLAIVDPFEDIEIERRRVICHTLAASADGRLLAGGGGGGVIQIFEFDTLSLVYKVKTSDLWIKQLAFSQDGLNLADLRGSQCNVWTPPILLGGPIDDDVSVDTSNTYVDAPNSGKDAKITALALIPDGVLCGKDDGSVCLYDIASGYLLRKLYSHKASLRILRWLPKSRTVMSVCISNRILAWRLDKPKKDDSWISQALVLELCLECEGNSVVHLLPSADEVKFILSTHQSDHFWDLTTAREETSKTYTQAESKATRIWLQHPKSPAHAICVGSGTARIYAWQDWAEVASIKLGMSLLGLQSKTFSHTGKMVESCWNLKRLTALPTLSASFQSKQRILYRALGPPRRWHRRLKLGPTEPGVR
ncbi:Vegetative incompatibility protein HET-E-1 [Madurella mycetomatis]|uniref:Vegetative incompatibility protein HET-E-1 n=1 Tax=Madurella mycetomatis TaxID=100816 RepID=A0A175W411_9PEZI|nr:Vegetative incompatibility protein HET-E-1 [Madurella mycetomatis]